MTWAGFSKGVIFYLIILPSNSTTIEFSYNNIILLCKATVMLMCLGSVSGLFYGEMQHHSSRRNSLFHFPVLFTGVEGGKKNLSTSCRMIWFEIWWARRLDATSRSCAHSDAVCWDRCHPAQRVTAAARWFNTMTLCSLAFHVEACSGKKERKKEEKPGNGIEAAVRRETRCTLHHLHF